MTPKLFTPRFNLILTAIVVAAVFRLIPHWPNFTPVAAMALFGGAYIPKKWLAFMIPIAAMLLSDLFLGFHSYLLAVYGSFMLTVALGILISKRPGFLQVTGASLLSSLLFFLITNFVMWAGNPNFSQDYQGLMQCYTVAIPFFHNGILGDLFYNGLLFGGFYFARQYIPALQKVS